MRTTHISIGRAVVAAAIAELLEMNHVIVPPSPGVYSAYGLLLTGVEHEVTRGHLVRLADTTPPDLAACFHGLEDELEALMAGASEPPPLFSLRDF